jgi:hypothetical protein
MKAGPPNDPPQAARGDENDPMNDPLWHLLARAPRPEPDGWFTVRTLARCRHEGLRMESGVISFARMWRWALGGGLALSMALALVVTRIHSEKADKQKNVQEAFEIMASIDTDSDSSSSSSWQNSSL